MRCRYSYSLGTKSEGHALTALKGQTMTIIDSTDIFTDGTTTITAHIEPDDTNLFDHLPELDADDALDSKVIEGWKNGQWGYVGIVVTVRVNGTELGSASLWAIEHGLYPCDNDDAWTYEWIDGLTGHYAKEVIADLVPEALDAARAKLSALAAAKLPTDITITL